eukprot:1408629-Amphidinium_carterae.1
MKCAKPSFKAATCPGSSAKVFTRICRKYDIGYPMETTISAHAFYSVASGGSEQKLYDLSLQYLVCVRLWIES